MQEIKMIQVADFSKFPGGSLRTQGDHSGQQFREDHLAPALRNALAGGYRVEVNLDGVMGLSTAFSREAFGGLVAKDGFSHSDLARVLVISGRERSSQVFVDEAWEYIQRAEAKSEPEASVH